MLRPPEAVATSPVASTSRQTLDDPPSASASPVDTLRLTSSARRASGSHPATLDALRTVFPALQQISLSTVVAESKQVLRLAADLHRKCRVGIDQERARLGVLAALKAADPPVNTTLIFHWSNWAKDHKIAAFPLVWPIVALYLAARLGTADHEDLGDLVQAFQRIHDRTRGIFPSYPDWLPTDAMSTRALVELLAHARRDSTTPMARIKTEEPNDALMILPPRPPVPLQRSSAVSSTTMNPTKATSVQPLILSQQEKSLSKLPPLATFSSPLPSSPSYFAPPRPAPAAPQTGFPDGTVDRADELHKAERHSLQRYWGGEIEAAERRSHSNVFSQATAAEIPPTACPPAVSVPVPVSHAPVTKVWQAYVPSSAPREPGASAARAGSRVSMESAPRPVTPPRPSHSSPYAGIHHAVPQECRSRPRQSPAVAAPARLQNFDAVPPCDTCGGRPLVTNGSTTCVQCATRPAHRRRPSPTSTPPVVALEPADQEMARALASRLMPLAPVRRVDVLAAYSSKPPPPVVAQVPRPTIPLRLPVQPLAAPPGHAAPSSVRATPPAVVPGTSSSQEPPRRRSAKSRKPKPTSTEDELFLFAFRMLETEVASGLAHQAKHEARFARKLQHGLLQAVPPELTYSLAIAPPLLLTAAGRRPTWLPLSLPALSTRALPALFPPPLPLVLPAVVPASSSEPPATRSAPSLAPRQPTPALAPPPIVDPSASQPLGKYAVNPIDRLQAVPAASHIVAPTTSAPTSEAPPVPATRAVAMLAPPVHTASQSVPGSETLPMTAAHTKARVHTEAMAGSPSIVARAILGSPSGPPVLAAPFAPRTAPSPAVLSTGQKAVTIPAKRSIASEAGSTTAVRSPPPAAIGVSPPRVRKRPKSSRAPVFEVVIEPPPSTAERLAQWRAKRSLSKAESSVLSMPETIQMPPTPPPEPTRPVALSNAPRYVDLVFSPTHPTFEGNETEDVKPPGISGPRLSLAAASPSPNHEPTEPIFTLTEPSYPDDGVEDTTPLRTSAADPHASRGGFPTSPAMEIRATSAASLWSTIDAPGAPAELDPLDLFGVGRGYDRFPAPDDEDEGTEVEVPLMQERRRKRKASSVAVDSDGGGSRSTALTTPSPTPMVVFDGPRATSVATSTGSTRARLAVKGSSTPKTFFPLAAARGAFR